ncbi:kinase-like domain-containing protein [Xylariomycetidae sp. FL2044]|nr:kinase-like domain-containing protein [Xylariomycetidae sp. FL2044]
MDLYSERELVRARDLEQHFQQFDTRFIWEGAIGQGVCGLVFRVIERMTRSTSRRLVVKRAMELGQPALRAEIFWLRMLNGAEHIVKLLAAQTDTAPLSRMEARAQQLRPGGFLAGILGPVMAMEYLENHEVKRLIYRSAQLGIVVPNRVLWHFMLCLVRACVAMAWPLNRSIRNRQKVLEKIPVPAQPKAEIAHNDLHPANVMIGAAGGEFEEHTLIPVLKIIDFGYASAADEVGDRIDLDQAFEPPSENIRAVARIMIMIICQDREVMFDAVNYNGYWTEASPIVGGAVEPEDEYPGLGKLDSDLRDMLAQCLAEDAEVAPSLEFLLQSAEQFAETRTAEFYGPDRPEESDASIRDVLQKLIYDANT